ncbi:prolyl oligopeptidase family serine peptidase [Actinospica durhamensis]|uniref:Prolyl oligopeptidase family serine peptidase n=1 Tax=Actinospica durhamensis TaxID=1508375 RepID=A0A941IRJ9_9ACTN|nr:prolyl oligopeptidase family serine peptidase [Actinospica durhamensis]MBR7837434.1 prolyl oligopeptidase family serine peptidase [Actinospica durhamensis]
MSPPSWPSERTGRIGGTHDFESQYLDSLVGPWPAARRIYHDRSPVNHPEAFRAPFALFQGLADTLCPPAQARTPVEAIQKASAVTCEYITFEGEGEGHGFRRAETIAALLGAELSLYTRTFAGAVSEA